MKSMQGKGSSKSGSPQQQQSGESKKQQQSGESKKQQQQSGESKKQQSGESKKQQPGQPSSSGRQQSAASGAGGQYGEGNYAATRQYNEGLKKHLENSDVEQEARDAAPRSDAEEKDMLAAERKGRNRSQGEESLGGDKDVER